MVEEMYNEKKSVVVLGGNKLHRGFATKKKEWNIDNIIVIDWNENPDFVGDKHYKIDIKDTSAILSLDINWDDVRYVYTSADIAVKTQAEIHRKLGLLAPSDKAIENALVKGNSTECWKKSGVLNKYSVVIGSGREFEDKGCNKYIFKPNCSSGSRNITILNRNELTEAKVENAVEFAKMASNDGLCIVEEFVEGIEFTVDMLGDAFGNVEVWGISKKYHTPYNMHNKIATKLHYAPGDVSEEVLKKIADVGQACYKSIGLSASFGHLEVIVTEEGKVVPVEMGARSSGYIATHLIDLINDSSYLQMYSKVIRGEVISNGIRFDRSKSSMYYFYDIRPGVSICKTDIMKYLPKEITSYANDRSGIVSGKKYKVINADHERYGFEILGGTSNLLNICTVEKAENEFNDNFVGEKADIKEKIINYIKKNRVSTTEVADCLGKSGVLDEILPINAQHFQVGEVQYIYAIEESNWSVHEELDRNPQTEKIVFIDGIDVNGRAIIGDIVSKYIILYQGNKAIVCNGKMRDAHVLIKENYPIWCKGVSPVGCYNRPVNPLNFKDEIEDRKAFFQGAIAVCDDSGVVIIPKEKITDEFYEKLEFIESQEDTWYDCIDRKKWSTYRTICLKDYLNE